MYKTFMKCYLFKIFCTVMLLCVNNSVFSQNTHSHISSQAKFINELLTTTESIGTSNPQLFSKNLEQLKSLKDSFSAHQSDYLKYLIYYLQGFNGEFNKSSKNFEQLFEESQFLDIKFRAQTKIVNINAIIGNIPKALNSLEYILNNIDKIKENSVKILGYKVASLFYFLVDEYQLAIEFSNFILKNNPTKNELCQAHATIIRSKIKQTPSLSSQELDEIKQAITACEQTGDYIYSNFVRVDWLKSQLNLKNSSPKDYQLILEQLKNSEQQIESTQYKNLINIKDSLFAKTYWLLGKPEKSYQYANKVLEQNISKGATLQKIDTLGVLIQYYKNKGDFKKAFEYSIQENEAEKAHFNQEKAKIMAYQTVKHNNLAKTQEINYLNKQNKLLSHEKSLSDRVAKYQTLLIISLIIIVIFILIFALKSAKAQKIYKKISEMDHMTQIYNRKGLESFAQSLLLEAQENNQSIAYAILDLDHFKVINDTYGHIVGDEVIKKVIQTCQVTEYKNLKMGRLGGEEFAMVLKNGNSQELAKIAEECRIKISQLIFHAKESKFNVTASFGVTSTTESGFVYSMLMTHADQAMYDAKIAGRNMVVQYQNN